MQKVCGQAERTAESVTACAFSRGRTRKRTPQRVERQNAHSLRDVVRFLVGVDGLGNMPSNRRAVPRQSGKTLPDRLLCAVICGDIHINGKTASVDPAKQALTPGRIADSALARIKARLVRLETGGTRKLSTKCIQKRGVCTTYVFRQLPCG